MDLNVLWNDAGKKEPPEKKIVLVAGPLGIDLAMNIYGHWYFKTGGTWEPKNLGYWSYCIQALWADFNYPDEQKVHSQQANSSGTVTEPDLKVFSETDVNKGVEELHFLTWI